MQGHEVGTPLRLWLYLITVTILQLFTLWQVSRFIDRLPQGTACLKRHDDHRIILTSLWSCDVVLSSISKRNSSPFAYPLLSPASHPVAFLFSKVLTIHEDRDVRLKSSIGHRPMQPQIVVAMACWNRKVSGDKAGSMAWFVRCSGFASWVAVLPLPLCHCANLVFKCNAHLGHRSVFNFYFYSFCYPFSAKQSLGASIVSLNLVL